LITPESEAAPSECFSGQAREKVGRIRGRAGSLREFQVIKIDHGFI
jgi:hypothetical protein